MKLVRLLRYINWLILALGAVFPLHLLLANTNESLLSSGFGIFTCCLVASPYVLGAGLVLLARSGGVAIGAIAINLILVIGSTVVYDYVLLENSGRESGLIFLILPFGLIAACLVLWLLLWLGRLVMRKTAPTSIT